MAMDNELTGALAQSCAVLKEKMGARTPEVGIILGSGLGPSPSESRTPSSSPSPRFRS